MMNRTLKIILLIAAGAALVYLHFYGIGSLVLGSDELHPARALISSDWSLTNHPWPAKAVREYYDNWPIQFPPLFGLLCRAAVLVLGVNALALRFFPALFAVSAIVAAIWLFRRFMTTGLAVAAALLMGMISDKLLIYAKSLKHYSADVLCAALLLYCGKRLIDKDSITNWLLLTGVAALSIWLAFASIYVIAAVYITLLIRQVWIVKNKYRSFWVRFFISGFVFALSFLGLYLVSIANAVENPVFIREWLVQIFHWEKVTDLSYVLLYLAHTVKHVLLLPAYFFFDSLLVGAVANLLILVWLFSEIKKRRFTNILLLILPLVFLLLASLAGKYPFAAGRLSLFLLPAWMIMTVLGGKLGYDFIVKKNRLVSYITLGITAALLLTSIYINFDKVGKGKYSGGRRVDLMMSALKDNAQDQDTVYLHWGAILPFYFYFTGHQPGYQDDYPIRSNAERLHIIWGEEHNLHPEFNEPLFARIAAVPGRLWVAFGHQWPSQDMLELQELLDSQRNRLNEWNFKGCKLILYAAQNDSEYTLKNSTDD
ncbi:MAG TPA: glycosyltransferase family 39 protein [bacterium]|nr:glycosyltransferase family 39 protein [bacterium]HPN44941.1 glycosyltransferase family 39 protein [bacterium]